jgi:hypothetical protein
MSEERIREAGISANTTLFDHQRLFLRFAATPPDAPLTAGGGQGMTRVALLDETGLGGAS